MVLAMEILRAAQAGFKAIELQSEDERFRLP
jgi:hypothetical protein